jgi:hypothetical protein
VDTRIKIENEGYKGREINMLAGGSVESSRLKEQANRFVLTIIAYFNQIFGHLQI